MNFLFGLVACAVITGSQPEFPDTTFPFCVDSLFNLSSDEQQTEVRIYRDRYTWFLVTTCKTMTVTYREVVDALEDITSYKEYFRFMKRSEFVDYKEVADSVALFEAGVAFYVAWYAGQISHVERTDRKECRLICGGMDQRLFRKEWKGNIGGIIRIGSHGVYLEWRIRDLGDGKTRVALTVSQAPAVYIPRWLLKIASRSIFPGMLRELETAVRGEVRR